MGEGLPRRLYHNEVLPVANGCLRFDGWILTTLTAYQRRFYSRTSCSASFTRGAGDQYGQTGLLPKSGSSGRAVDADDDIRYLSCHELAENCKREAPRRNVRSILTSPSAAAAFPQ